MSFLALLSYMWHSLTSFFEAHQTLLDGLKVAAAGIFFEAFRRGSTIVIQAIANCLYLKARINASDDSYDWLHQYLSKHAKIRAYNRPSLFTTLLEGVMPAGRIAPRDVQVLSRRPPGASGYVDYWDKPVQEEVELQDKAIDLTITPSFNYVQAVTFNGWTLKFKIYQRDEEWGVRREWIEISCFLGYHGLIRDLISQARTDYLESDKGKIAIYNPHHRDTFQWTRVTSKPMRPWDSVILPSNIKNNLLADAQEFINESEFYTSRGLPYRRGYLLYGSPGSGKSSLIAALAAKLHLDIYIVNIGSKKMEDTTLSRLLGNCPSRCILLMEDIDCAFKESKKDEKSEKDTDGKKDGEKQKEEKEKEEKKEKSSRDQDESRVTLSGLLNALDGVASSEGRLLFCTTNHVEKIDPALSRPGRCDVWVKFSSATKAQAYHLFLHFYPQPGVDVSLEYEEKHDKESDEKSKVNGHATEKKDNTVKNQLLNDTDKLTEKPNGTEKPLPNGTAEKTVKSKLDREPKTEIERMASDFAEAIPANKVSVSAMTAYLMRYKRRPEAALADVVKWVEDGFPQGATATYAVDE